MKIASLFSGIGGFEKGLQQADPTVEIVFSCDIDKYARQVYKKNFGVEPHGDITQIDAADVPDHDILCGGFPCQAFSVAGKRRGFEDTRGTLFFEIMRIAEAKRPKLLFLENVRGLLSHDGGRTFHTILRSMDDVGYDAEWQVFNSKNHGVPQNRERVFIIGHLRGSGTRPIFPITEDDRSVEDLQGLNTNTLTARYEGAQAVGTYIIENQFDAQRVSNIRRLAPTECERLQGFPQLESYINIDIHNNTICVDLQKSYANVETKNHKQRKHVGNVEKSEVEENVSYAEQNLNINYLPINKHAQKSVVINCVEGTVEIHNQKKSYSFANYVESQNSYLQHIKTDDFVHLLVGINTTLKNVMHFGKEVLHQNEQYLIQVRNGKLFVKLYGKEMMQSVNDAKIDLIILKKHLKYIMSNHLNLESVDYNWTISFCYVMNAITGCIQKKTQTNNSLNLEIKSKFGYTFGISDTQRYKCIGNAVTVNVVEHIGRHLLDMLHQ